MCTLKYWATVARKRSFYNWLGLGLIGIKMNIGVWEGDGQLHQNQVIGVKDPNPEVYEWAAKNSALLLQLTNDHFGQKKGLA